VQPGSSGRDVDIRRRQEAVGLTDDAKLKSSCATRASPALAHGADEGYSIAQESSAIGGTDDNSLAASASQTASTSQAAAADDRFVAKNGYHSVRSLKHKNDRSSYKSGTGSADLHRASSLQELNESGMRRPSDAVVTENDKVSCGLVENDVTSGGMHCLHDDTLSLPSDACSATPACAGYAEDEQLMSPPRRSRCRTRQLVASPELVSYRGIVSNTAQFWEDLVLDSKSSLPASRDGTRPRHVSEDRCRFLRRDLSCPRYLTIASPREIVHGIVPLLPLRATSDVVSGSESLHVKDIELKVCCCIAFVLAFVACPRACLYCPRLPAAFVFFWVFFVYVFACCVNFRLHVLENL